MKCMKRGLLCTSPPSLPPPTHSCSPRFYFPRHSILKSTFFFRGEKVETFFTVWNRGEEGFDPPLVWLLSLALGLVPFAAT